MSKSQTRSAFGIADAFLFGIGGVLLLFSMYLLLVGASSGVLATGNTLGLLIYSLGFGFAGFFIMSLVVIPKITPRSQQ